MTPATIPSSNPRRNWISLEKLRDLFQEFSDALTASIDRKDAEAADEASKQPKADRYLKPEFNRIPASLVGGFQLNLNLENDNDEQ